MPITCLLANSILYLNNYFILCFSINRKANSDDQFNVHFELVILNIVTYLNIYTLLYSSKLGLDRFCLSAK